MTPAHPHHDDDPEAEPGVTVRPLTAAEVAEIVPRYYRDLDDASASPPAPVAPLSPRPTSTPPSASDARAGSSAIAEYRRRRAVERDAWRQQLPGHLLLVAAVLVVSWFVGAVFTGPLPNWIVWAPATAWAVWTCRPRTSADTRAWKIGARGERATGRLLRPLERRGWVLLHDLSIPGSRANVDHLAAGPGGVFVIDSKRWKGYVWVDGAGHARRGSYSMQNTLDTLWWETSHVADALADLTFFVPVRPVVALHRGRVPASGVYAEGVAIIPATRLVKLLEAQTVVLDPAQISAATDRLRAHLPSTN